VFVERDGIVQPAPAPRFNRTALELDRLPPRPGQDSVDVLNALGYDPVTIQDLIAEGVIGTGPS